MEMPYLSYDHRLEQTYISRESECNKDLQAKGKNHLVN